MPVQPLEAGALQSVQDFAGVVPGRPSDTRRASSDIHAWSRSIYLIGGIGSLDTVNSGITRAWSGIPARSAVESGIVLQRFCGKIGGKVYHFALPGTHLPPVLPAVFPDLSRMIGCSPLCNGSPLYHAGKDQDERRSRAPWQIAPWPVCQWRRPSSL